MKKLRFALINLAIFGLVILIYFAFFYLVFPSSFANKELCLIKTVTGYPCPGCGMTRAYLNFFSGNLHEALHYHPLFLMIPVIILMTGILFFTKKKGLRLFATGVLILCILLLISVYIYRMSQFFPEIKPMDYNKDAIIPRLLKPAE